MYHPGPGEALSGQGARSQRSYTAAHCPGLRAASQRQGGEGGGPPFGPCSWDMFLGLWGWQLEVAAQRAGSYQRPLRCRVGGQGGVDSRAEWCHFQRGSALFRPYAWIPKC